MAGSETPSRHGNALESALLALAIFFFVSSAIGYCLQSGASPILWRWLLPAFVPLLSLLLGTVVILRHFNLPLSQTSNRGQVWVVLTAGATLGAAGGLIVGGTPPTALAPNVGSIAQYLYAFAWVGISAPLIEELFFRGVLQQTLLRPPASAVTILIPAALFMTAHLGVDPLSLYFLLGLGFGIIAYVGRSVWPAVAAHIAWNTASLLVGVFPSVAQSARPVLTVGTLATLIVGACWLREEKRR